MLDDFVQIPMASDDSFIEAVIRICKSYRINVIQPLVTRELEKLSENIALFESMGVSVCVAPIENLSIANDKRMMLDELAKQGIAVPKYQKFHNAEEFMDACRILGHPERTVCFKPSKANGSRGFRIIDADVDRLSILLNEKPNSTYIDLDQAVRIFGHNDIPEMLAIEYLPGTEYSEDMLLINGESRYCVIRKRNRLNGGISVDCIVVDEKDVETYAVSVAQALHLHGNIGIQLKRNCDGDVRILEINPRVQGSIVCCAAAGVNLPWYGIKAALGEELPAVSIKYGTRMIRYWNECLYDYDGQPYSY